MKKLSLAPLLGLLLLLGFWLAAARPVEAVVPMNDVKVYAGAGCTLQAPLVSPGHLWWMPPVEFATGADLPPPYEVYLGGSIGTTPTHMAPWNVTYLRFNCPIVRDFSPTTYGTPTITVRVRDGSIAGEVACTASAAAASGGGGVMSPTVRSGVPFMGQKTLILPLPSAPTGGPIHFYCDIIGQLPTYASDGQIYNYTVTERGHD